MGEHKSRFLIRQRAVLKACLIRLVETNRTYGLHYQDILKEEYGMLGYKPTASEIYKSCHELVEEGVFSKREELLKGKRLQKIIIYNLKDREKASLYKKQVKIDLERCYKLISKVIQDVYGSVERTSEQYPSADEYKSKFLIKQQAVLKVYLIHLAEADRLYGSQFLDFMRSEFSHLSYRPEISEIYKSLHELADEEILKRREQRLEDKKLKKIIIYNLKDENKANLYKDQVRVELERCYSLLGKIIDDVYGPILKKKSAQ